MVTRTLYDFVTDRAGNAQTPPEGFLIKGMNSKLYNNSMREYVAKKARFRDDSTAIVASYVTGPDAVGSDVSLTLAQAGGFMDPPPVGLLLGFRVSSLNSNPLWLTIDGTNFYPVKGARGTNLLPSSLQPDSLYLCVFNGMEWQLLGNQKGTRRSGQAIRTRTDAVTLDLQATDLENTVAFVDSGAAGGSVTLVISDEMLTRWPIGGCIEFLNINYKSEVGISVDQSIVVPTSWDGGDGSRKLPLTTQSNEFVHFKLLRTTALELRPILNPRFVR